ncbi:MAG TPA: UDP-N-acetylmuramate--L-alanine ligase [Gemmatimonadaceae bacterium]|nr:UDP-N-acetylmuramate--L-alanine ligase [Gemmatimonadaceae bacterium]
MSRSPGIPRFTAALMPLLDPEDPRPIHFVGIAGAGMSALAELFARRGARVTGCDAGSAGTDDLVRAGISAVRGHDPSHVAGARALVVSSAIPRDHPELAAARAAGIPIVRRAEALGEAVAGDELVAIAGTHGKTTTTVMTTEALRSAGLAPTGVVGGRVPAWGGNLSTGGDRVFVVEADEYDRSFLALAPTVAVVTNIEADHLDIYRDLDDIRGAFTQFVSGARKIVLCADDPGAAGLAVPNAAEALRYGIESADARLVARDVRADGEATRFDIVFDGEAEGSASLRVPGEHNVLNALAALAAGIGLGAGVGAMLPGLESFTGVERRFQRLGVIRGVTVVDDYAHHPTEIRATLAAARAAFPGRRVIAAFQPHLFSRTRDFAGDFGKALSLADALYLTEIYPAREQPIPGVTAEVIAAAVRASGGIVAWRGDRSNLAAALAGSVRDGDVVLTIGAGDVTRTGPELLERLRASA